MRRAGRNSRTVAKGMIVAVAAGAFTWWLVSSLGICPSEGDLAGACRAEAGRIGLKAAAWVAALIGLITVAIILSRKRAPGLPPLEGAAE